jgi:hypothetical protein
MVQVDAVLRREFEVLFGPTSVAAESEETYLAAGR